MYEYKGNGKIEIFIHGTAVGITEHRREYENQSVLTLP
jgi:hypothetical protein